MSLPINQRAYINSFLRQVIPNYVKDEYSLDDLSDAEQLELYKMMLPKVNENSQGAFNYEDYPGNTYSDVSNPTARREMREAIKRGDATEKFLEKNFPGANQPMSDMDFLKNLSSPTFALKSFLGGFSYYTDENGDILIDDVHDYNMGKEGVDTTPLQAFKESLSTEGSAIFNVLRGLGSLGGPKEGEGAPVHLNLGKKEEIMDRISELTYLPRVKVNRIDEIFDELEGLE
jgi:hypothetical protein